MHNYNKSLTGVWFVYDGDCPICSYTAQALCLRQEFGALHLLNARKNTNHPLMQDINQRELNLDEGMVIYCEGTFYHGKDALHFMSRSAAKTKWYNMFNFSFFQSKTIAGIIYPMMKLIRNSLLLIRGKNKIRNLIQKDIPIFKPIFGEDWDKLPLVMKRHYANRPYSNDKAVVEGIMDVVSSPLGRLLKPFFKLSGTLVPYEGSNVPVTVTFASSLSHAGFHFNRVFFFPDKKPYQFKSVMYHVLGNEIIEVMRFGLCWRAAYIWTGQKIILEHRGYALRFLGHIVPVPLGLFIGKGNGDETPIDDNSFSMSVAITHPLWGKVFGYNGIFKMIKDVS